MGYNREPGKTDIQPSGMEQQLCICGQEVSQVCLAHLLEKECIFNKCDWETERYQALT
jgi:hypothetical protein